MTDDQNTTQNPISEDNTQPTSFQEPMADVPIPATDYAIPEVPPEAPEAPRDDFEVKSNDVAPHDSTPETMENKVGIEEIESKPENTTENQTPEIKLNLESVFKPIFEPVQASESPTAQIPVNEPFNEVNDEPLKPETQPNPEISKPKPEPAKEEIKITEPIPLPSETKTEPKQEEIKPTPVLTPIQIVVPKKNLAKEFLIKARNIIQFRKRKKLDKIMALFLKNFKITNDEVEKFLNVSDATATRYLSQLEKEGKIKQSGKTGHMVSYSKI